MQICKYAIKFDIIIKQSINDGSIYLDILAKNAREYSKSKNIRRFTVHFIKS